MSAEGSKSPCPKCNSPDTVQLRDWLATARRCMDCGHSWLTREHVVFKVPRGPAAARDPSPPLFPRFVPILAQPPSGVDSPAAITGLGDFDDEETTEDMPAFTQDDYTFIEEL